MRRFSIVAVAMLANLTAAGAIAYAQDKPPEKPPVVAIQDPLTLVLPRQVVGTIGQGLMKLPYETAAPILNDLQTQLNKADQAATEDAKKIEAEKAAAKEPAKDAEKPKPAPNKDAK